MVDGDVAATVVVGARGDVVVVVGAASVVTGAADADAVDVDDALEGAVGSDADGERSADPEPLLQAAASIMAVSVAIPACRLIARRRSTREGLPGRGPLTRRGS